MLVIFALAIKYPTVEYYIIIIFFILVITNENPTYSCLYICGISGSMYATLYIMSSNEKSHSCLYICEIKRNVYTILFSSLPYTLVHTIKYDIA